MKSIIYIGLTLSILYLVISTAQQFPFKEEQLSTQYVDVYKGNEQPKIHIVSALKQIQQLELDITPLKLTLNDCLIWGGEQISINGDGAVTYQSSSSLPPLIKNKVSQFHLYQLIDMIIAEQAWQHQTQPPPEHHYCRANLSIEYKNFSSTMWEWTEELQDNQRLIKLKDLIIEVTDKR